MEVYMVLHDGAISAGLLYLRLHRALKEGIEAGRYPPLSQLPKENELAQMHRLSRVTVRKALALLEEEGLLVRVRGRGTFVAQRRAVVPTASAPANAIPQSASGSIAALTPYNVDPFVRSGMLTDLRPFLEASTRLHRDDFIPELLERFTFDGRIVGLPIGFGATVAYVNLDLCGALGELPCEDSWTWDDLEQSARKSARFDADGRLVQRYCTTLPWPVCVWMAGGECVNAMRDRFLLDSTEAIQGLKYYHRLSRYCGIHGFAGDHRVAFQEGRLPVLFATRVPDEQLRRLPFRWRLLPVPKGQVNATWVFMHGYGMLRSAFDPQAEWRTLEERVVQELSLGQSEQAEHCPASRRLLETIIPSSDDIHERVCRLHVGELAHARYVHTPCRAEPLETILQMIDHLANDEEWPGDAVVREAVRKANAELRAQE
jgi:DNA-binding transcriptional regulator YhcF (GntR family)